MARPTRILRIFQRFLLKAIDEGKYGRIIANLLLEMQDKYLLQAKNAMILGMEEAASLLCRGSMEGAMYILLFINAKPTSGSALEIGLRAPRRSGSGWEKLDFGTLFRRIAGIESAGGKFFSRKEREALRLIGEHGNTVAHVQERFHHYTLREMVRGASQPEFHWPESKDIKKDLAAAQVIMDKIRSRLASEIQEQASRAKRPGRPRPRGNSADRTVGVRKQP